MSSAGIWQDTKDDIRRYGGWMALWREQSIWPLLWFRLGCALLKIQPVLLRKVVLLPWWLGFRFFETLTGISLPLGVSAGGGVRIWHFGGIFIHPNTVIGRNCTLRQGVTLGNRHGNDDAPLIGSDVEFGAYAQVLGAVRIGDGAKIGALSVVLCDVPAGHTAVGSPARVLPPRANAGGPP